MSTSEPATVICAACGQPFTTRPASDECPDFFRQRHCDPCSEKLDREREAERERERRARLDEEWATICPPEFRTIDEGGHTDLARLKAEQPRLREVMQWQYGRKGLLLVGATGRCKTRSVYRLLRREHDAGRRIRIVKAYELGDLAAEKHRSGSIIRWLEKLSSVPLLFLDDLGKQRGTEAEECHLFGIVDARSERGLPTLFTTNSDGPGLMARMRSEDRAAPFVRRLREFNDVVDFGR